MHWGEPGSLMLTGGASWVTEKEFLGITSNPAWCRTGNGTHGTIVCLAKERKEQKKQQMKKIDA